MEFASTKDLSTTEVLPETGSIGVKEKLINLRDYLPDQEEYIYEFGEFLSTRAHDRLVPFGFNMMAQLAIYDLQRGMDGFTKKPITGRISGYPPTFYSLLGLFIADIASAVFGKKYGDEVAGVVKEVNEIVSRTDQSK